MMADSFFRAVQRPQKFGWDCSGYIADALMLEQKGSCVNRKTMAHCDSG
jgi:hypothetical protein